MLQQSHHTKLLATPDQSFQFTIFTNMKLGSGGYGECYLAYDQQQSRTVAIKVQRSSTDRHYRVENSVLSKLQHSTHVVGSYKVHLSSQNNSYIVMEYCNMGTLKDLIDKRKREQTAFKNTEIVQIMQDVLSGYHELIKFGLVHQDLKPSNILIHDNIFKIGDFGLTHKVGHDYTKLKGTKAYIPLEKFRPDRKEASHFSDIYSLGIILFEMIYQAHPYRNKLFEKYCVTKKGGLMIDKRDEKKFYTFEYLQQSQIDYPEVVVDQYDPLMLTLVDRMLSHDPMKRPDFIELYNFFSKREAVREKYQLRELKPLDQRFLTEGGRKSIIQVEDISKTDQLDTSKCHVNDILAMIEKNRNFVKLLDKFVNPIRSAFIKKSEYSALVNTLNGKIALVCYLTSKQTYEKYKQMKKSISNEELPLMAMKANEGMVALLYEDIQHFDKILSTQYNYDLYKPLRLDLELTKITSLSRKLLEKLEHLKHYGKDKLRAIDNLLNLFNIHAIRRQLLDEKGYKQLTDLRREDIMDKFIEYEISPELYL